MEICVSIVFKAKTKDKYEEKICWRFLFQNLKCTFSGVNPIFSSVIAFKTIDTQMLFRSVFLKAQNFFIKSQKQQKLRFWWSKTFFSAFSKILTKRTFVRLLYLKLNQSQKTKTKIVWGFFFKNKNSAFSGVQNSSF